MITHYLKVAVRNLLKYRTQSIVSVLGLAIGFACVSLSMYWNHYEMTYDAFQKISFWVFLSIFVGVSALVTLCIGYRVWKAANENPADVVKSE